MTIVSAVDDVWNCFRFVRQIIKIGSFVLVQTGLNWMGGGVDRSVTIGVDRCWSYVCEKEKKMKGKKEISGADALVLDQWIFLPPRS